MPRFSANISMLFTEAGWLDRPAAAAAAGFTGVEVQFPYYHPPADWAAAVGDAGLAVSVINVPVGDLLEGGPGLAAMPGREADFARALEQAATWAQAMRPRCVNVLPGSPPADLGRERCEAVLAANLAAAADVFAPLGVRVVLEPVNTVDRPGFFLDRPDPAVAIIDRALEAAGGGNLALQFDLYHMQVMGEPLVPALERLLPRIGHIQFADAPGRHEPGTGVIDFPAVFETLDRLGWDGWTAAEYVPSKSTPATLDWLAPYLARG